MFRKSLPLVVFMVAASAAMFASVTFDPETGIGFVGKGDVQSAFGWNNSAAQNNAKNVTFTYTQTEEMRQDCYTDANEEQGKPDWQLTGYRTKTREVGSEVAYDARKKNQYTGYNLTGLGHDIGGGVDVEQQCPAGGTPKFGGWYPAPEGETTGVLSVCHGGTCVPLQ